MAGLSSNAMNIDIFIRSCEKDWMLLNLTLDGIAKYLTGYRKVILVVPHDESEFFRARMQDSSACETLFYCLKIFFQPMLNSCGYIDQQMTKLRPDSYSDADFFLHLDSDQIPVKRFDVRTMDRLWYYCPYSELDTHPETGNPWQAATEWACGIKPEFEYMRRGPYMLPRALYAHARLVLFNHHHVNNIPALAALIPPHTRAFSEYNLMGLIAHQSPCHYGFQFERDVRFVLRQPHDWLCTLWSWGIRHIQDAETQIELFKQGISYNYDAKAYVVTNDSHFRIWVEENKRLDFDDASFLKLEPFIRPNSTIVDVGANIGIHTKRYADKFGAYNVVAFEPNHAAYMALIMNVPEVRAYKLALGDSIHAARICVRDNNGASSIDNDLDDRVYRHQEDTTVMPLDHFNLSNVGLLHIDAEGYEPFILRGAIETIKRCRPVIYIEVNSICLRNFASSSQQLVEQLERLGYDVNGYVEGQTQQDVVALPVN